MVMTVLCDLFVCLPHTAWNAAVVIVRNVLVIWFEADSALLREYYGVEL
jgi:hypothetical protein